MRNEGQLYNALAIYIYTLLMQFELHIKATAT